MPSIHTIKPDLVGQETAAWKVDQSRFAATNDPRSLVTLDTWIVYAKWSHPLWPYHVVGAVALRDHPDLPPAVIRRTGATHELFVFALNPDYEPSTTEDLRHLTPINFTAQFIGLTDEQMNEVVRKAVVEIIEGRLNPDTDGVQGWIRRFGADGIKLEYRDVGGHA